MFGGVIDACVLVCPITSTCHRSREGYCIWDVQPCLVYFVMVISEVTTHAPNICTAFSLANSILFFFVILASGRPPVGHVAAWSLNRIEEFQRSVCTWKFLRDFTVLEPCDVNVSKSAQSAMSQSPDSPSSSPPTLCVSHEDSRKQLSVKLMQPCVVF